MSNRWRREQADAWFRIGRLDVTTTVLVVLVAAAGMVVGSFYPPLISAMVFTPPLFFGGEPWRALTWPLADTVGLWSVLHLAMLWFFGGELERMIGLLRTARFLGGTWLCLTGVALVIGLAAPAAGVLAGLGVVQFLVLLVWIAEYPHRPFFFGIPAWVVGLGLVAIQVLGLVAQRGWASLGVLIISALGVALVARWSGLLSDYRGIPGGRPSRTPRPSTAQRADARTAERARADRERLDDLLDKINDHGLHTLSEAERAEMLKLRERLRGPR